MSFSCAGLFFVYLILVATTIFFATWQTDLVRTTRTMDVAVSELESKYYESIAHLHRINPSSLGFVAPDSVAYVSSKGTIPALSRADQ